MKPWRRQVGQLHGWELNTLASNDVTGAGKEHLEILNVLHLFFFLHKDEFKRGRPHLFISVGRNSKRVKIGKREDQV